jgi:type IX secretion system PorP/SprF family membrane protein
MRKIYITIILILILKSVNGQDLHFSQFFNTPLNINPGLTGVYNEDMRFGANLRSQWFSVPVPYTTFSMAYDQKILNDGRLGNNILAAGIIMNYDQAGDANMQNIQLGGSVAYTRQLSKMHFLSGGFRLLVAQRRFDVAKLTFDNQFIDGTFIPTANTGEDFDNFNYTFVDIGTGINWLFQISKRMNFNLGIAGMHLNQPRATFFDNDEMRQAVRWNLQLSGIIQLAQKIDLMPSAIFSMQGTQQERIFGSAIQYHLNQKFAQEKSIRIGTWYRMNDAIITGFGLTYPTWMAMVSYDFNTSEFSNATNGIGSVEFSFQYKIQTVKRMKDRKVCPIF